MSQQKIFSTPLTEISAAAKEPLGSIRWVKNSAYKYVKMMHTGATVTGAAGDCMLYFAAVGYSQNRVVVDDDDADAVPFGAGVLLATIVGADGVAEYGWIQIKGPHTLGQTIAGSADDGQPLSCSGSDTTLTLGLDTGGDSIRMVAIAADDSAGTVCLDYPF